MFTIAENKMELTVDDVPMKTTRIISIISGKYFLIGGKMMTACSVFFFLAIYHFDFVHYIKKNKLKLFAEVS